MTRGSWIVDDLSRHFADCSQCRETGAQNACISRPGYQDVREVMLGAMCSSGRPIYREYLRWLSEPDA